MTAALVAGEMTLAELLSGTLSFEIPEFQRDYRWSQQEARQLFEDISSAAADSAQNSAAPPYFLGAIVLLDHPAALGSASLFAPAIQGVDIVDGQQRLITLSILIACLRDFETGETREMLHAMLVRRETPNIPQLTLRTQEQPQFEARVLRDGATRTRGAASPANSSIDNVLAIRNFLLRELRLLDANERRALATYLRLRCRMLVMRTGDIDYAYQIFLTINDRGRHLTREDILRAEIIGPLSVEQRRRYETVIDEFTRYQAEAGDDRPKKGKTFFSHLAAIHGAKGKSIIAEVRRLVKSSGGPARFGAEVFVPLAEAYLTVKRPTAGRAPRSPELESYLTAFRWYEAFGDDDWVPLAMLWLGRFGGDTAGDIAFFRGMDCFALALRALGSGHRERERRYSQIREFLQTTPARPDPTAVFALSAAEQRMALNRIAKRCWKTDPQLCRLVLMRLDAHFTGRDPSAYDATLGPRAFTVEHILPQAENPPQEWRDLFTNGRRRLLLAQCLGNLILVPPKVNEEAGALPFPQKKATYFKRRENPFHLTNELNDPALVEWTEASLLARQTRLLQAVQEIWRFEGDLAKLGV
jgi:Protein of unknown function DUF262/Protein of unknown function (DUF1524)